MIARSGIMLDEARALRDEVSASVEQVVDDGDFMPGRKKRSRRMTADETGAAGE